MNDFGYTYKFMDERCQRAVCDILKIFDGAPLHDVKEVLECVKQIIARDAVWHMPKPEPEENETAEMADKVASHIAEALKKFHVDKPLT